MSRNPERELEEFLTSKPAWMRRTFETGFPSLTQTEISDYAHNQEEVFRLTKEYELLLQQIPAKWKEYRERRKREFRETTKFEAQFLLPKGNPGRPRLDERAAEATLLKERGMKIPQIAGELNKKLGKNDKTTPDAVRKLLKRRSHADKT